MQIVISLFVFYKNYVYFCKVYTHAWHEVDMTLRKKASLMLCFWLSETSTIQINQSRATAEMNATGEIYTPGVCRGLIVLNNVLMHTLGCVVYLSAWVFRLCSFTGWAVEGLG